MADITFLLEFEVEDTPATCEELGRVTRAYVSGYQRNRVHASRLVRGEKRCLVANFNGAIPAARTLASVTWRMESSPVVVMADASIAAATREARVMITASWPGYAAIKCEATLDNGEVYTQLFQLSVRDSAWFSGEPTAGPGTLVLTVTA